jgi:short-subunit dehydrogenase
MSLDLRGKAVLLTGASSGIGWATAKALAAAGARVGVSARREEALTQLALQIRAAGGEAHVLPADLSVRGEASALAARATKALGQVDVLVNNAGVGMAASQWMGADGDVARRLFETNVWSPLALTAALVPEMRGRGYGAVVNVASMGAVVPFVLVGHYGASKAALATATLALRNELRGSGIGVTLVLPGPVETAMLAEAKQIEGIDGALAFAPPGRAEVLAKMIVRAIASGRREIVYPRMLWLMRIFPRLGELIGGWSMRKMNASDARVVAGGSNGDREALEAREKFESERAA